MFTRTSLRSRFYSTAAACRRRPALLGLGAMTGDTGTTSKRQKVALSRNTLRRRWKKLIRSLKGSQTGGLLCSSVIFVALAVFLASDLEGQELFNAAKTGKADEVRRLLAAGAAPDLQKTWWNDKTRRHISDLPTCMMAAAQSGHTEAVKALIEGGADVNLRNLNNKNALEYAASGRNLDTVTVLLDAGSEFDVQDIIGNTPLMDAVRYGRVEITRELLDHGANPDLSVFSKDKMPGWKQSDTGLGGETALMIVSDPRVADQDGVEIVRLLIAAGASIDIQDHRGKTALMHAVILSRQPIVEVLLEAGARVDVAPPDISLFEALQQFCTRSFIRNVKPLLKSAAAKQAAVDGSGTPQRLPGERD